MIMAESVFEAVKQSVAVREAAQMYGIEVNRSGMACCPFHDDKNPSMKLNEEYFYCFGCGATGDVIDFTARLYNLSPKEAAEKLAQDFGLAYALPHRSKETILYVPPFYCRCEQPLPRCSCRCCRSGRSSPPHFEKAAGNPVSRT